MPKERPSYKLENVKSTLGNPKTLVMTHTALNNALSLGFTHTNVAHTIANMEANMFYKTMESNDGSSIMQDVYHVPSSVGILYVKFREDVMTEFKLLSFKIK